MIFALLMLSTVCALAAEEDKENWTAWNKYLHDYRYYVHIGYNIGGTAPVGLPASIRTLHSYTLQPNFVLGVDAHHSISGKWGFLGGLHFENKACEPLVEQNPHMDWIQAVHPLLQLSLEKQGKKVSSLGASSGDGDGERPFLRPAPLGHCF